MRKPVAKLVMPPRKVAEHYMQMNEVARDLIEIFRNQRDNDGVFFDVTDLSFRWGLECEFMHILWMVHAETVANLNDQSEQYIDLLNIEYNALL